MSHCQEKRYSMIFQEAPIPIISLSKENKVQEANHAALQLVKQICTSQYRGLEEGDLRIPKWLIEHIEVFKKQEILEDQYYKEVEHNPNIQYLQLNLKKLLNEDREYEGMIIVVNDISEQKRIQEELETKEQKVWSMLDNMPIMIDALNKQGNVVLWNKECERITGYSPEEIKDNPEALSLVYPEKEYREEMIRFFREKTMPLRDFEVELRCKDGSTKTIAWYNITDYFPSQNWMLCGLGVDVTKRKIMEKELVHVEKLNSISIMAGGIAHDFNNILTIILGNISLAKKCVNGKENIYNKLVEIQKAALQAKELTQQLLSFSKEGEPVKKNINIKQLIKETVNMALSGTKSLCRFSIAQNLWPVEVDKGQISQVLNNLVINANQAMSEGGMISIRAENVVIEQEETVPIKEGKYVKITVKDRGSGIPEEHLHKIFDPYFTTKQQGSGLGLAASYAIIRKHNGYITVKSKPSIGTSFYIYLPVSDKEVIEEEKSLVQVIKGKGHILVMDDEKEVREVNKLMLIQLGYEVELAKEGVEALALYESALERGVPFDTVILDLTIKGGMGGEETAARLLELDPKAKIIIVSGYNEEWVLRNFDHQLSGFIKKPYTLEQLAQVLHEVINEVNIS